MSASYALQAAQTEISERRTFQVEGFVDHGDKRGRLLGFPTANIKIPECGIQNGAWAGTVQVEVGHRSRLYVAAISVGRRPTYYEKGERLLEANLLNFSGDLYGQEVLATLVSHLRPQRRFAGTSDLVNQIHSDVASVRAWSADAGLGHLLDESHVRNVGTFNTRSTGRPHAVGSKRSTHDVDYVDKVRQNRAARRADILGYAIPELARTGNLTHKSVAVQTGIPLGYLLWRYPTNESLLAAGGPV